MEDPSSSHGTKSAGLSTINNRFLNVLKSKSSNSASPSKTAALQQASRRASPVASVLFQSEHLLISAGATDGLIKVSSPLPTTKLSWNLYKLIWNSSRYGIQERYTAVQIVKSTLINRHCTYLITIWKRQWTMRLVLANLKATLTSSWTMRALDYMPTVWIASSMSTTTRLTISRILVFSTVQTYRSTTLVKPQNHQHQHQPTEISQRAGTTRTSQILLSQRSASVITIS